MTHVAINAHLLSAQAGYRSAGIHGYIYNMLRFLPHSTPDWRYTVLVGEGRPPAHPQITVRRSAFSTQNPLQRIVWEQLIQPVALAQLRPDVYHAPAYVAPLLTRQPTVVTVHDLSFIRFPESLSTSRRSYLQTLTRLSCQRAAQVIAVSQSTAQDVMALLKIAPEKITVAISGVNLDEFRPLETAQIERFRQQQGLPRRFLLHLGTLEPRKNLPMLLRAYAALPQSLRDEVHLVLAGGKGWDYQAIFETVENFHMAAHVHFPGYVEKDHLPLWYNAADALVYPSIFEGWGLPVVEAMACGRPTLVSDVSSLPEAAGETGLKLPPDDESAWTEALRQAITDADWRAKSGQAGLTRVQQFTWQAAATATVHAYQKAIGL